MIRFGLLFGLAAMGVHSQCPPPSNCPGSGTGTESGTGTGSGTGAGSGCGSENTTCKKVNTIVRTITDMMGDNPLYYTLFPNRPEYTCIDSKCLTVFPLPDNMQTATIYESTVYVNGSTVVDTLTGYFNSTDSTLVFASPSKTNKVSVMGYAGCGAYVSYLCGTFGDNPAPFVFALGPVPGGCAGNGTGKLGISCQIKAESIVDGAGLTPPEGYYTPPFNLATDCMVQQLCLPKDNPIYCQQGGTCQPYDESPAATCQ